MTLEELVKELLKEGIYGIGMDYDKENDSVVYTFSGFAKSGEGSLKTCKKDGKIHLLTRYGQDDIVESIEDVLYVAYVLDSNYCCKYPDTYGVYSIDENWAKLYIKYGYNISSLKH